MGLLKPNDEDFMREAMREAEKAFEKDEIPVGAVIVCDNHVIARTHNLTEQLKDVTAHAEMQAFTAASDYLGSKFLEECVLYVTLEPCTMCAGASYWTRIGRIVYGSKDEKRGYSLFNDNIMHPSTIVTSNILANESAELLKAFFKKKR
ncbi:MAG: nucleoside deaminase [Bacteroidales bacterium]|nr:nucleoside deaminase [Bacteroidales bacterium]